MSWRYAAIGAKLAPETLRAACCVSGGVALGTEAISLLSDSNGSSGLRIASRLRDRKEAQPTQRGHATSPPGKSAPGAQRPLSHLTVKTFGRRLSVWRFREFDRRGM